MATVIVFQLIGNRHDLRGTMHTLVKNRRQPDREDSTGYLSGRLAMIIRKLCEKEFNQESSQKGRIPRR